MSLSQRGQGKSSRRRLLMCRGRCFAQGYIRMWAENNNLSIAIPYGIGCSIANGDWNKVYKIIEKVFEDYDVTLYKLGGE